MVVTPKKPAPGYLIPMECYCCRSTIHVEPDTVKDMEALKLELSCVWCQADEFPGLLN